MVQLPAAVTQWVPLDPTSRPSPTHAPMRAVGEGYQLFPGNAALNPPEMVNVAITLTLTGCARRATVVALLLQPAHD